MSDELDGSGIRLVPEVYFRIYRKQWGIGYQFSVMVKSHDYFCRFQLRVGVRKIESENPYFLLFFLGVLRASG